MPTIETLILRRSYPVPVTFADLRAAGHGFWRKPSTKVAERIVGNVYQPAAKVGRRVFQSLLKEATGATDDIYAVIDGHEVRVATITGSGESATANLFGCISAGQAANLLIAADEAGYWERPHDVRVVLQERPVSVAAVERAVNVGWTARGGSA